MPIYKDGGSHPVFELYGSEARTRAALAFIPDPERYVTTAEIAKAVGKPSSSVLDAIYTLHHHGLIEKNTNKEPGPMTFKRVESELWVVYETAKIAFTELGIEIQSLESGEI